MDSTNNIGDIKAFFLMLRACAKGAYPLPWGMFCWVLLFLVYFISPIDIVPDYLLPILGFADDAALLLFTTTRVKKEINKFRSTLPPPPAQ